MPCSHNPFTRPGKRLHNYGKSPCLIAMLVKLPEGIFGIP